MNIYEFCFHIAIVAFVYCEVLIQPGHILHPFFRWLTERLTVVHVEQLPDSAPDEVKTMPGYEPKTVERVWSEKRSILKALGDCPYCTTGQLALWVFLFRYGLLPYVPETFSEIICYTANLIFFISLAILISIVLKKLYDIWGK